MSNMRDLHQIACGYQVFFQALNTPKLDHAGGAYDAPPDSLLGWGGGHPFPILFPLNAFGVSKLPL